MANKRKPAGETHNADATDCGCLRCRTLRMLKQFFAEHPFPADEQASRGVSGDEEVYAAVSLACIIGEIIGREPNDAERTIFLDECVHRMAAVARIPITSAGVPDDDASNAPTSGRMH